MTLLKKMAVLLVAVLLFAALQPAAYAADTEDTIEETSGVVEAETLQSVDHSEDAPEATEKPGDSGGTSDVAYGYFSSSAGGHGVQVDNAGLKLQIALVNGLHQYDYTIQSWKVLQEAFEEGKALLGSTDQEAIYTAEQKIKDAIAALVKMDYSELEDAMDQVEELIDENPELHDVWIRLYEAVAASKPLLVSGDQAAVDEAAKKINELLAERLQYADVRPPAEVVVQEVEVEVLPTDDFCNIPVHRIWPMLFFISLALNVALAVLLVYVIVRKKNTTDDTPLVDYDIDDDIDDDMY